MGTNTYSALVPPPYRFRRLLGTILSRSKINKSDSWLDELWKILSLSLFIVASSLLTHSNAQAQQEAKRLTLLILGDSLTAGYGVQTTERYPALIESLAKADGFNLHIINAGLSGDTSAGGLRRIPALLDSNQIDFFLLALGGNDALRGLSPSAMEKNLRGILHAVTRSQPEAKLLLAGMEAPPNLGPSYTEQYRAVFRTLATEFNATLIPFLLEGVAAERSLNQADAIHPNPAGHRIMASLVWGHLKPLLRP